MLCDEQIEQLEDEKSQRLRVIGRNDVLDQSERGREVSIVI